MGNLVFQLPDLWMQIVPPTHETDRTSKTRNVWRNLVSPRSLIDAALVLVVALLVAVLSAGVGFGDLITGWLGTLGDGWLGDLVIAEIVLMTGIIVFCFRRLNEVRGGALREPVADLRSDQPVSTDGLTGLPNRTYFLDQVSRAIVRAERNKGLVAVVAINIRRFTQINDGMGPQAGDRLLIAFAELLRPHVRASEYLARLDADNFGLLLEFASLDHLDDVNKAVNRLRDVLSRPVPIEGASVDLKLNIGVSLHPFDATNAQMLLRYADAAMRKGKTESGSNITYYEQSTGEKIKRQAELELELVSAINSGAIVPSYQPLIDIQRGTLVGYEILARWRHPSRGTLLPEQFIPIAEAAGTMTELTMSVLESGCRTFGDREFSGSLALNVSPKDLRDPWFPEKLLSTMAKAGFPANRLEIEITENCIVEDPAATKRAIMSLKNQGVRIALDDFGAGYSNLSQLSNLAIDKIKIDRLFVSTMLEDETNMAVVRTIIGLANVMEIPVLAEGIETREQAETLRAMGCDFGQGFFFAKPLAPDDLSDLTLPEFSASGGVSSDAVMLPRPASPKLSNARYAPAGSDADEEIDQDLSRLAQIGQLSATVAHQLRNPLGSIRNAAYLMKRKAGDGAGPLARPLERIDSAISRCDNLISQLLTYARANTLELDQVDLDAWIESVIRDQADSLPDVVDIRLELAAGGLKTGFDPHKMECAINNLVNNASEAMVGKSGQPDEMFCENPVIVISSCLSPRGVEIAVYNNGPAIPPDALKKILQPLYTTKSFGTGLGLPLVADYMRLHNGGMEVKSGETSGVTFTLWFPIVQDVASACGASQAAA